MDVCGDRSKQIKNISNLDYLFHKSLWCIKNNFVNGDRLCMYIEHIIQLSTNSFVSNVYIKLLKHLMGIYYYSVYGNFIIMYLNWLCIYMCVCVCMSAWLKKNKEKINWRKLLEYKVICRGKAIIAKIVFSLVWGFRACVYGGQSLRELLRL